MLIAKLPTVPQKPQQPHQPWAYPFPPFPLNSSTTAIHSHAALALLLLHAPLGVLIGRIMEAVNTIRILLSRLAIQNSGS